MARFTQAEPKNRKAIKTKNGFGQKTAEKALELNAMYPTAREHSVFRLDLSAPGNRGVWHFSPGTTVYLARKECFANATCFFFFFLNV